MTKKGTRSIAITFVLLMIIVTFRAHTTLVYENPIKDNPRFLYILISKFLHRKKGRKEKRNKHRGGYCKIEPGKNQDHLRHRCQ